MSSRRNTSLAPIPASKLQSPPEHPGERLANYFDNFFKTVLAISTVGANITFSKVVQSVVPPNHTFSKSQTLNFIGYSFFFFVLTVAFTALFTSLLSLYKPQAVQFFGIRVTRQRRTVMWYATFVSSLIYGLLIVAFVFIALVVVAYVGPAGWASLVFVILFAVVGFTAIISQSPLFMGPDGKQDLHLPHPDFTRRPSGRRRGSRGRQEEEVIYYDGKNDVFAEREYDDDGGFQEKEITIQGRKPQYDEETMFERDGRGRRTEVVGGHQQMRQNQQGGYDDRRQQRQQQTPNPPTEYEDNDNLAGGDDYALPPTQPPQPAATYDPRDNRQLPAYDPSWKYSRDGSLRVREFEQRNRRDWIPPTGVVY